MRSTTASVGAKDRYWAVDQMVGRPDGGLEGDQCGAEPASAEEEPPRRGQLGHDHHLPVQQVALGLHAEEVTGVGVLVRRPGCTGCRCLFFLLVRG